MKCSVKEELEKVSLLEIVAFREKLRKSFRRIGAVIKARKFLPDYVGGTK